nr:hypothetical protein [Tanacetum cinerariifolium]
MKINALHLSSAKQITTLNDEISNLNKQLSKKRSSISSLMEEKKRLKHDFKTREDTFLDNEVDLEARIKDLENILLKMDQTVQTMHMLNPKPDSFYHPNQKIALGYPNPSYLKKAQLKQQILYNGNVLLEEHDPPVVYDSEETLELAQESREKMRFLKKEIKPANYAKINHLSRVFVPQTTKSKEELFLSNVSNMVIVSKTISIPNEDLSDDTTLSVARKFPNEVKSSLVTLQRVVKQKMTLEVHNWSSSAHKEVYRIISHEITPIINQVDARVQNFEIQFLQEAAKFVRDFKSLAKEAGESLDKQKSLELEIERLLKASVSHDIMSIVKIGFVDVPSDLLTELDRTKEKLELCIIKKEKEYAVLWNNWYTKFEKCKYDKISYDKAYNDMQQKVERLQAHLRDLKGKSSDTPSASNTLDPLNQKLESKIVELEFQVVNYEREISHFKTTYKNLFESISSNRAHAKLHYLIYENAQLRARVFENTSESMKNTSGTSVTPRIDKPKLSAVTPLSKKLHASMSSHSVPQPREFNVVKHRNENVSSNTVTASFTGLEHTARTRRPQPKGNTRNARVPSASNSSEVKKNVTVEEHHRTLLLSKNQKTMSSKCNNIKLVVRNDKSESVCAIVVQICLWCVDSGCSKHMTGNIKLLINFVWKFLGTVRFGNDHIAAILGYGDLKWSPSEGTLASLDIWMVLTCSKAILWNQRLSHLNFDTINDVAKNDLVSGLPKFKYAKEHLCPSCEQGKSKRASHPPKPVPNSKQGLHLIHMDLCGPMQVASINGKSSSKLSRDQTSNPTSSTNPTPKGQIRRSSKQKVENSHFEEHLTPVDTMTDNRTMAEMLRAPTEGYAEAIVVPPILAEQFELKHSLINMMTSEQFFRLKKDNPHDHIPWGSPWWLKKEPPQKFDESFHKAWERYKDLLRACPHHGFTELHQLDTFYNALNPADQDSLNAAAGGNLLEKSPQDALTIIENKSKVKAVEQICVTCGGAHPYYQCVSAGGNTFPDFRDNIQGYVSAAAGNYNQGNPGYRPYGVANQMRPPGFAQPNVQNNQNRFGQPQGFNRGINFNQEQPYQATAQSNQNFHLNELEKIKRMNDVSLKAMQNQIDMVKNELRNEMKTSIQTSLSNQTNEIKNMMASLLHMNTASTSGSGSLPGNTVANSKGELKGITTRIGLDTDGPTVPTPPKSVNPEEEECVEETYTDADLAEYTIKVPPPPVQKPKPPIQRYFVLHTRDSPPPHIPYPSRMLKQKQQEMTFKFNTVILKKLPEKLRDPGKFLIPCGFSELKCKALTDLGASINLMPLSVWKKLGLPNLIPTRMTLELANRAICTPNGIAGDVFIPVGKFTFPADFVIVDYESDPRVPFILGRPFLRTARALIDVHASYSNHPHRESVNLINIFNISSEDCLEVLVSNKQSDNPTFSLHKEIASPEVTHDSAGCNFLSEEFPDIDSFNDIHPYFDDDPLSGSTTFSSNSLLEEFTDELALITYPLDYDDNRTCDIESDLKEIELLLYQGEDSDLKDSIDHMDLANLDDLFVDPTPEMLTDEQPLDYSFSPRFDGEKIKEAELLIDQLNLPCDILPHSEYDSFNSQDFFRDDDLPSPDNEDKDFDPPFYELLVFKDVPNSIRLESVFLKMIDRMKNDSVELEGVFKRKSSVYVKEYQKKDKIRSKPDKNGKRGEAGKRGLSCTKLKDSRDKDQQNFVVLDFIADSRVPLILGRPFLSTAHTIINVHEREIILRQDQQSLTIQCGDIPSIKKFEQINKIDFINAGESDSEEIENFLNDDLIPLGVEDSPFNMEEDIIFLESLLREEPCPNPPIISNQTKSPIEEPTHSLNMGYEHFNTNLVTKDVAESSTKNLVPVPHESEVVSNNGSKSIEHVKDDSSVFTTISNPLFDNNNKINSDELNSQVEFNSVEFTSNHDTVKFDNLDEFSGHLIHIHIVEEERIRREHADYINRMEMLFTINPRPHPSTYDNTNVESFSSLPIPIQKNREVDVVDDLHVDNSISNSEHKFSKSEDSDFDNPSVPLPPPEPPDEEFDFESVFSVVRNTIVKFECIDAKVKFDVFKDKNDDLSYFMFVKVFSFLSAESEDTIFDPGISD